MSLAKNQVSTADELTHRGAPVAALVCPELQPFAFDDANVTLWQYLNGRPITDLGELGRTVRSLHSATRDDLPAGLPSLDFLTDISRWIDTTAEWPESAARLEIERRFTVLKRWWDRESADDPLGILLVHGDVHRENTIVTKDGDVVLVDLEDAGVGPASWDLVPLAVGVRRFGDPAEEFQAFVSAYGADPNRWSGFERLCEIYELSITVWAIRCAEKSSEFLDEARIRLDGILGRGDQIWTLS